MGRRQPHPCTKDRGQGRLRQGLPGERRDAGANRKRPSRAKNRRSRGQARGGRSRRSLAHGRRESHCARPRSISRWSDRSTGEGSIGNASLRRLASGRAAKPGAPAEAPSPPRLFLTTARGARPRGGCSRNCRSTVLIERLADGGSATASVSAGCCELAEVNPVEYLADVLPQLARRVRLCDVPASLPPAGWRRVRAAPAPLVV